MRVITIWFWIFSYMNVEFFGLASWIGKSLPCKTNNHYTNMWVWVFHPADLKYIPIVMISEMSNIQETMIILLLFFRSPYNHWELLMLISSTSDSHQNKAVILDLLFRERTQFLLNHAPTNAITPDAAWLSAFKISQENAVSQKRIPTSTTLIRKLMSLLLVSDIFVCDIRYIIMGVLHITWISNWGFISWFMLW